MTGKQDDDEEEPSTEPVCVRILPSAVPVSGGLQAGSPLDWGWQGLVAWGSRQGSVLVVDPVTHQLVQTLCDGHQRAVTLVCWQRAKLEPNALRRAVLATADVTGVVCVWDIGEGVVTARLAGGSAVTRLCWLYNTEGSAHLLLVSYADYVIKLWDSISAQCVWKHTFSDRVVDLDIDPFDGGRLAILSSTCIFLVNDLSPRQPPAPAVSRIELSSLTGSDCGVGGVAQSSVRVTTPSGGGGGGSAAEWTTRDRLRRVFQAVTGDSSSEDSSVAATSTGSAHSNQFQRLLFVPSCRDRLLLAGIRDLLWLDLAFMHRQRAVFGCEGVNCLVTASPLTRSPLLLCVADTGTIQLRYIGAATTTAITSSSPNRATAVQSEQPRLGRHCRAVSAALDPVSESRCAVLLTDGRLMLWDVLMGHAGACGGEMRPLRHLTTSLDTCRLLLTGLVRCGLPVLVPSSSSTSPLPTIPAGTVSHVSCMQMSPRAVGEGQRQGQDLLACGTYCGHVLLLEVSSGRLRRQLAIHGSSVRGVEWVGPGALLTHSHSTVSNTATAATAKNTLHNELVYTDLYGDEGASSTPLRSDRAALDRSALLFVRVSSRRQYAIVVFATGQSPEIWCLATLSLLRVLPEQLSCVTALVWAPAHATLRVDRSGQPSVSGSEDTPSALSVTESATTPRLLSKEHFVFTVGGGHVCHFSVEGRLVRDGARLPLTVRMASVGALAWRANCLALGDCEGRLCVWHLASRQCRVLTASSSGSTASSTHSALVLLRFVPTTVRGSSSSSSSASSLRLMTLSAAGVLCVYQLITSSSSKGGVEQVSGDTGRIQWRGGRVQNADWASPQRIVLITADDGSLRVADAALRVLTGAVSDYRFSSPAPALACLMPANCLPRVWRHLLTLPDNNQPACAEAAQLVMSLPRRLQRWLSSHGCVYARAVCIAMLLGNECVCLAWRVAAHHVHVRRLCRYCADKCAQSPASYVDADLDALCDSGRYRQHYWSCLHAHLGCVTVSSKCDVTDDVIYQLIVMGETELAVQLLLREEPQSERHYTRALLACVLTMSGTGVSCPPAEGDDRIQSQASGHSAGNDVLPVDVILKESEVKRYSSPVTPCPQDSHNISEQCHSETVSDSETSSKSSNTPRRPLSVSAGVGRDEHSLSTDRVMSGDRELSGEHSEQHLSDPPVPRHLRSVLRATAAGLVAGGQVQRGVQLLCAARLADDAVRYLMMTRRWREAVHVTHCRLASSPLRVVDTLMATVSGQDRPVSDSLLYLAAGEWKLAAELLDSCSIPELGRVLADI